MLAIYIKLNNLTLFFINQSNLEGNYCENFHFFERLQASLQLSWKLRPGSRLIALFWSMRTLSRLVLEFLSIPLTYISRLRCDSKRA